MYECAFVCVLLLLQIGYICFNRTFLFLFWVSFFHPNNQQTGCDACSDRSLAALTQTYTRQVCRGRETKAPLNNRVTSTLKGCTHKDVHVPCVHLSSHQCIVSSHSAPTKEQVPADGGNMVPSQRSDWLCPSIPTARSPN